MKWLYFCLVVALTANPLQCAKYHVPRPHNPADPVVYPPDHCQSMQATNAKFDYVVIGAGPAGATLARRLAENPEDQVLLIEAGDDPPTSSDFFPAIPKPFELWNITVNQKNFCMGFQNHNCLLVFSKVLGGCSVINGEMYVRGNPQDYEDWKSKGNPGWAWKDMFPYFLKLENFNDPYNKTHADPAYHSNKGPFTTSPFPLDPQTADLRNHLEKAISAMGIPLNKDFNGKSQIGFGTVTGSVEETGYRNNIAKSYLLNIPDNLKVCKNSLVTKLKISANKIVEGVEFLYKKDTTMVVKARKDYIITAGPINTPQILERSGIGDGSILEKAKVKLIHELKGVGNNLQDQYATCACIFEIDINNTVASNPLGNQLSSFTGFLNLSNYSHPVPDIQYYLGFNFKSKPGFLPSLQKQLKGKSGLFAFGSVILRQSKKGYVHISSKDPLSSPNYNPNQYTSAKEAELTTKACQLARKIMSNPKMAKFKAKSFVFKECSHHKFNSEDEIMCGTRLIPVSTYHLSGSAAMGPKSNEKSVVDTRLRVHGIKNLRIADLSVMPDVPRGNTEVPTIAVAERAADIIKKDHK